MFKVKSALLIVSPMRNVTVFDDEFNTFYTSFVGPKSRKNGE